MKPVAFKTNPRKMGFRELFRVAGSFGMGCLACVLKLFGLIGPDGSGFGMRSFGGELTRLPFEKLPRRAVLATEKTKVKLEKLGFVFGFAYSLETFGTQEAHGVVFRHKSGLCCVSIAFARNVRDENETSMTVVGFNTELVDGTYIMTSGGKRMIAKPENFECEWHPGKSPKEVYERHMDRVDAAESKPRKVKTDDDLETLVLNCENEETSFNMERGVYVKMTKSEMAQGREMQEDYRISGGSFEKRRRHEDERD